MDLPTIYIQYELSNAINALYLLLNSSAGNFIFNSLFFASSRLYKRPPMAITFLDVFHIFDASPIPGNAPSDSFISELLT